MTPPLEVLIRDPRYWRDREPELVARVCDGLRGLTCALPRMPADLLRECERAAGIATCNTEMETK